MVLVRLDNNSVLWMEQRITNQDFYPAPLLRFPACPLVQLGENPGIFIRYQRIKEIDSVN
jgi:hypothetical protein